MNNVINARARFAAAIIESASKPKKDAPESTKIFYVNFSKKKILAQEVVVNGKAA